jgi:hypothetical protein
VSFNEGGLSCSTISDEDQLECGHGGGGCHFVSVFVIGRRKKRIDGYLI